MDIELYVINGKLRGHYDPSLNAIIDTWSSLLVSLEEFRANIYETGVNYAIKHRVSTWIVDTSKAEGVFRKEVQAFIESNVAPKFAQIGIKYFFVILPQSAIAKLSARNVAKINSNQEGMQTIQVGSMAEVLKMLETV